MFPRDKGFYATVRQRVGKYFEETGLDSKSPVAGLWRMAIVFLVAGLCFAIMNGESSLQWFQKCVWLVCFVFDVIPLVTTITGLLLPDSHFAVKAIAAAIFGICQVLPLLHIMHDASHTAIGRNEKWWKVVGRFSMEWFAGASMMSWQHQHTIGHHVYTNLMGFDPDMPADEEGDPRRLVKRQVRLVVLYTCALRLGAIFLVIVHVQVCDMLTSRHRNGLQCTSTSISTSLSSMESWP